MPSFEALGYTLAAGTFFSLLTISVFGIAVRYQQEAVAPRCAARPKETIHCANPIDKDQDRGNPWFGWIRWTLRWSYETLLRGIPGTGTRKNGLEGCMLKMNLDAIIFLRFNSLCLRVATLTTILVILVILPANWTGNPDNTLNTFNRTTLANIPPLHENNHNITAEDILTPEVLFQKLFVNLKAEMPIQARLYAIVLCSWIVTYFLCFEISKEWKDNLVLRRKYYFEADHYKKEMDKQEKRILEKVDYISKRDPWVPDPEEDHTVANIGLYSLLVGDVPPLPQELNDEGYTEQQEIDWQTATVTTFFDNCLPHQPGFTSSIAAITILPTASSLTKAWKEWNKAASALRRLRCIMSVIAERRSTSLVETGRSRGSLMKHFKELNYASASQNSFADFAAHENMSAEQRMLMLAECDDEVEGQLMDALHYGPQQKACYGREFAQASASIFGKYFSLRKYQHATNEELTKFEIEALLEVEEANMSLKKAQMASIQKRSDVDNTLLDEATTMKSLTTSRGKEFITKVLSLSVGNREIDDDNDINLVIEDEFSTLKCRMSGEWIASASPQRYMQCLGSNLKKVIYERPKKILSHKKSTYAIVTFTNRQAAVAARQCLADGRGGKHWNELKDIPTPPLADGSSFCSRDFLRPVTVTIPKKNKVLRNWIKRTLLVLINFFWAIPLAALSSLSNSTDLATIFPNSEYFKNHNTSLDGLIYALLYSLFVSICPYMFEVLACWGSNASSLSMAELSAMKYYWIFILMTSFTGVNITNSIVAAMKAEHTSSILYDIMKSAADTIPVSISFNWLNIIMKNTTFTLPFIYLLQTHFSFFALFGCKNVGLHSYAIAGSPLPYRAYIDCGTVLLCAISLGFASPLVAPCAAFFFLWSEPIMRRCFIYVYLPEFDGGGFRWPFLSEMCYSSMIVGQIMLLVMISFKRAIGPAILSFFTIIPTALFRKLTLARYYQAYVDTSLLQTASLDMCNPSKNPSLQERQGFRDFLVDAHKAAYIPVCFAGVTTSILTAEPAVAVPTDLNIDEEKDELCSSLSSICNQRGSIHSQRGGESERHIQRGTSYGRHVGNTAYSSRLDLTALELGRVAANIVATNSNPAA